jgi:glucosamine-6-phosphate deaminase
MRVLQCASKEQLAYEAAVAGADRIRQALHRRGSARIVLGAGMSQAAMLEFLVHENLDWGRVTAFHSDEYVGIEADHPGSFRKFLKDRFVEWVPLNEFHAIYGERNPVSECRRLNKLLANRRIDVAFVGIGENGHIAFNDPPADFKTESPYLIVKLDAACRRQQVKEGWFGTIEQVPTKAITMSVRKLLSAEHLICSVPEKRKAKAVRAALEGPVTSKVPASALQRHARAAVFLDPESASLLGPTPRPVIYPLVELSHCPEPLGPGLKRFHLFAAADWRGLSPRDLRSFARRAATSGAATVTVWGPGAFDAKVAFETDAGRGSREIPSVSYKPEELDQALFYFLEDVKDTVRACNAWVAVVVSGGSARDRIMEALGNPGAFIDRYIALSPDDSD